MLTRKTFNISAYKKELQGFLPTLRKHSVGIIDGPMSAEDRLYIEHADPMDRSVNCVAASLARLKIKHTTIDPTIKGWFNKLASANPLFITIHGEYGEDGRVQGMLDVLGKNYVGSGVSTSAIGLSKPLFKNVVSGLGYDTPAFSWSEWEGTKLSKNVEELNFPIMAKPVSGGSSIGMAKIDTLKDYQDFIAKNDKGEFFFEEFVKGRILTVAMMDVGSDILVFPPLEVKAASEFYDEKTKLNPEEGKGPSYTFPQDLLQDDGGPVQQRAYDIFKSIGGKNYARVDFMLDEKGKSWALEVNTLPGLSRNGNFPVSGQFAGFSYDELIVALLKSSLENQHFPSPNNSADPLKSKSVQAKPVSKAPKI